MSTITRQQARSIDQRAVTEYGLPSVVLMENAGRGLADAWLAAGLAAPVVICCGPGNNGGDGFVMARHLDLRGVEVRVLVWCEPQRYTGDAAVNLGVLRKTDVRLEFLGRDHDPAALAAKLVGAGSIVDALLGTGAVGDPRPPLAEVIDQLNAHAAPKLAVDLPSGLDCDSGAASAHTIRAAHTCTFVARKRGFDAAGASAYTGIVHVLDIGAPRKLVEEVLARG